MLRRSTRLAAILAALPLLVSCGGDGAAPATATPLTVFAAASLRSAFERIAADEAAAGTATVTLAFDASSTLRAQLEQGAPADVFASADERNAELLVTTGLATDPTPFATNALTIIVRADAPPDLDAPADLARPGLRIAAAGDEVPITRYAQQLIARLAALPEVPPRFAEAYAANVVSREDNVAAVRSRVELGEADAAIVYASDAAAAGPRIRTIDVPAAADVPATYVAVGLAASGHGDAARAFLERLRSQHRDVLADAGFGPPP